MQQGVSDFDLKPLVVSDFNQKKHEKSLFGTTVRVFDIGLQLNHVIMRI
jgi:hypothetical protein